MNLVIDIGNSRAKAALFSAADQVMTWTEQELPALLESILNFPDQADKAIYISTRKDQQEFITVLNERFQLFTINAETKLPFINKYQSGTLGHDRIAAISGAISMFPDENLLIIDAGTCITIDFVSSTKIYSGGSISPGISMRYKSLHNFTGKLPFLAPTENIPPVTGMNTDNSIHSGVINGVRYELEGFINAYEESAGKIRIVMTGGDAALLAGALKNPIFTDPFLVLKGLNTILTLNAGS